MNQDEQFVREKWDLVHICDGSYRDYARGTVLLQDRPGHWLDFPSQEAAAEFTRNRLEQIRQVEEEIEMVSYQANKYPGSLNEQVFSRTLKRLESALAELRRGMKEASDGR